MMLRYFLFVSIFIFSGTVVFARDSVVIQEIQTQTKDGVELKGVRYVNESGPRALFIHGLHETTRIFKEQAELLNRQGFDVYMFNFRGQGQGEHLSQHPDYHPYSDAFGVYSFDSIVGYDVMAMVDFVYSGEPILALGHSMGGVALRMFLSGMRMGANGLYVSRSANEIEKYIAKVKVAIANASPTSFRKNHFMFQFWRRLPLMIPNLGVSAVANERTPTLEERSLLERFRSYINEFTHENVNRFLLRAFYSGLINFRNLSYSEKEAGRIFLKGFSRAPYDLLEDIHRWTAEGFWSRSGISFEGMRVPESLRFYQFAGADDKLASIDEMLEEHRVYGISPSQKVIAIKGASHIDMASGSKNAQILIPAYMKLYNDPAGQSLYGSLPHNPNITIYKHIRCRTLVER